MIITKLTSLNLIEKVLDKFYKCHLAYKRVGPYFGITFKPWKSNKDNVEYGLYYFSDGFPLDRPYKAVIIKNEKWIEKEEFKDQFEACIYILNHYLNNYKSEIPSTDPPQLLKKSPLFK